jgi:hypothetical protein
VSTSRALDASTLRVRLGCDSEFRSKAEYVFTVCAAVWGARLEIVGPDEEADLAYGETADTGCAVIPFDHRYSARLRDVRDLADLDLDEPFQPRTEDAVATAFHHLARVEEYVVPAVDAWWRFPALASGQAEDGRLLAHPVNDAFARLQLVVNDVRSSRGEPPIESRPLISGARFAVALTHDIDALRYWSPSQAAAIPYRLVRDLRARRAAAVHEPLAALQLLARRKFGASDPYWLLGAICELERDAGARSTFFFLGEHRHALDGRDGAHYHRVLPKAIEQVRTAGAEIGLHASTAATLSLASLEHQRAYIERLSGRAVNGVRFHNLLFRVPDSVEHLARGRFSFDTTMGFAAAEGFRAGSATPFPLYSLPRDAGTEVVEIPLVVMDTTFLSSRYQGLTSERVLEAIMTVLGRVRDREGAVSILWHNSGFDDRLTGGFGTVYRRVIQWISDEGGVAVTAGEIAAAFSERLRDAAPRELLATS